MTKPGWQAPPVLIKILEAQKLIKLAEKAELDKKIEAAERLLKQQLEMLEKTNNAG
jgi:hypothetical protein